MRQLLVSLRLHHLQPSTTQSFQPLGLPSNQVYFPDVCLVRWRQCNQNSPSMLNIVLLSCDAVLNLQRKWRNSSLTLRHLYMYYLIPCLHMIQDIVVWHSTVCVLWYTPMPHDYSHKIMYTFHLWNSIFPVFPIRLLITLAAVSIFFHLEC